MCRVVDFKWYHLIDQTLVDRFDNNLLFLTLWAFLKGLKYDLMFARVIVIKIKYF